MQRDLIRKELQNNKILNPFNKNFSVSALDSLIEKGSNMGKYSLSIANKIIIYNEYYKSYIYVIKDSINMMNNNCEKVCELLFAMSNRETYLAEKEIYKKAKTYGYASISDIQSYNVKNNEIPDGQLNMIQVIEMQTDICNTILNIVKHCQKIEEYSIPEEMEIEYVKHIFQGANLLLSLKESYNVALWEEGYIEENDTNFTVRYIDERYPIIRSVGEIRMQENELYNILEWQDMESSGECEPQSKMLKSTNFTLDTVEIKKGYLDYSLRKCEYLLLNNKVFTSAQSQIHIYYPYFEKLTFSQWDNLCIEDIITIFSKISDLVDRIYTNYFATEIDDKMIEQFNMKIQESKLIKYIKSVTVFTKNQIIVVLKLLSCSLEDKIRLDLWKAPLYRKDGTIYFLRSAITAPNIFVFIDYWLEQGGYDLKKRGKVFENYIKKEMNDILKDRRFSYYIAEQTKFYNYINNYEEIDMFLNLKSVVIVVEIKCIKYPLEARAYHNSLKIIEKAVNQINKKIQFIKRYSEQLCNYTNNIDGKDIIGVVITNFTTFSGIVIEGVPIIDYNLFKSYFEIGQLNHVIRGNQGIINMSDKYYENEDEMCKGIREFLHNPPSIRNKVSSYCVKPERVTLPNAQIPIFQEFTIKKSDM